MAGESSDSQDAPAPGLAREGEVVDEVVHEVVDDELDARVRFSESANPRLDRWLARTTMPLDLLALSTVWFTVVPLSTVEALGGPGWVWFYGRIVLSLIYGVDMTVRTALAHRRLHYFFTHPISIVAVFMPAVRLIFSLRLLGSMFRQGQLSRFLIVATVLLANIAIIVWGYESRSPNGNIDSIGDAIWWACVTVATVGYGDLYPVTVAGRFFAVLLMALGLITVAVITAQLASTFMDQAAAARAAAAETSSPSRTRRSESGPAPEPDEAG